MAIWATTRTVTNSFYARRNTNNRTKTSFNITTKQPTEWINEKHGLPGHPHSWLHAFVSHLGLLQFALWGEPLGEDSCLRCFWLNPSIRRDLRRGLHYVESSRWANRILRKAVEVRLNSANPCPQLANETIFPLSEMTGVCFPSSTPFRLGGWRDRAVVDNI